MMYEHDEMLAYRCPRWNDWPDLDLYMDQVINVLGKYVAGFYPANQPNPVTSTMINNYVKQKILHPSKNKKYSREHLALLYILFLLKPVLSLSDISDGIACLTRDGSIADNYDSFCDELEAAIQKAFGDDESLQKDSGVKAHTPVTRAIALAFSYNMLAKCSLEADKAARTGQPPK